VAYSSTHGGNRNPNPPLLFPHLAVALKGGIVVGFELLPKRSLLLGAGEDAALSPRGDTRREVLALPPFPKPAFEGGKGNGEGVYDILPGNAPIDRIESPESEILRVNAHACHLHTGPLYSQTALDATEALDARIEDENLDGKAEAVELREALVRV
jgi:hypothetical protein